MAALRLARTEAVEERPRDPDFKSRASAKLRSLGSVLTGTTLTASCGSKRLSERQYIARSYPMNYHSALFPL